MIITYNYNHMIYIHVVFNPFYVRGISINIEKKRTILLTFRTTIKYLVTIHN
jgi:hypothetical protein